MKKLVAVLVAVAVVGLPVVAHAEPYKSKKFPPDEVLAKYLKDPIRERQATEIIGKRLMPMEGDSCYVVCYVYEGTGEGRAVCRSTLGSSVCKLDTNIWMIGETIIQK